MVVNHWFHQVVKIMEAMEITSNATKIKLAAFQLEDESMCGRIGSKPRGTWRQ